MSVYLPARSCQFHGGVKDERGFLAFCGKPAKEGYSYCGEHVRRVYQRVPSGGFMPRIVPEAPTPEPVVELPARELEREAA